MPDPERDPVHELRGWGRTAPSVSRVVRAAGPELAEVVTSAGPRGVIARGLGRSYGDAAQNAGGTVVHTSGEEPEIIEVDGAAAVRVGAGVSLHELMRLLLPRGLFVPVSPGTRQVSIGGAVAADVHGKNHHVDGSFADHLVEIALLGADGQVRRIGPDRDPDLFWATAGGMGLTGVVVEAVVRLLPIETAYLDVETQRVPDVAQLMQLMRSEDEHYRYSVAWVDTLARGSALGRSVLTRGNHASPSRVEGSGRAPSYDLSPSRLRVPAVPPRSVLTRLGIRAFNELWFRKSPTRRRTSLENVGQFFHPLDGVADWNRLYGPRGLVQYQFVVPDGCEPEMQRALELIAETGHASFLAVLKRFGPGNPGPLSFPTAGWTLALDLPVRAALAELFRRLDDIVISAGGRVYLAKDSRLSPGTLERMYPRLEEFRELRRSVDPGGVFQSDLSRRLKL